MISTAKHVAIIMDGNGRWAKKNMLKRFLGHKQGIETVRNIIKHCHVLKVDVLTLFAFSSENKNRSKEEVSLLFKFFFYVLKQDVPKLNKYNVKLKIIGDMSFFSKEIQLRVIKAQQILSKNSGLTLIIAANYGGQWDIVESAKKIAGLCVSGKMKVEDINVNIFANHLSLKNMPSIDLLIRTGGDLRISNFLLWDIAYSELYFTNTLWPDFNIEEFEKAVAEFNCRDRRFGIRKN